MANLNVNEGILAAYPRLKTILKVIGDCQTRILVVADGDIAFGHRAFGLSRLLEALRQSCRPGEEISITTAHRDPEADGVDADFYDFKFNEKTLSIGLYEQVWLFGHKAPGQGGGLTEEELKVLAEFMNQGGGVFATGDHADLGYSLCGNVPRVRNMRKWCITGEDCKSPAPPRNDPDRHSTVLEGHDPGFQVSDESDDIPQTIYPTLYLAGSEVHPLLANGQMTITTLPDHMHEGECVEPTEAQLKQTVRYRDCPEFDEFPSMSDGKTRPSPKVIALSVSAGGPFNEGGAVRPAVIPRCFGAICAYDGDCVSVGDNRVGRVVVDASFHHFLDMNLDGIGAAAGMGFFDDRGHPTKAYEAITRYYRNIMTYLNPCEMRQRYYLNLLIYLRFMYPLVEEIQPDEEWSLDNILKVGALTRRAISNYCSPAEVIEATLMILNALGDHSHLRGFIAPWLAPPSELKELSSFINFQGCTNAILGAWLIKCANLLSHETQRAAEKLHEMRSLEGGLVAYVRDDVSEVVNLWVQIIEQSGKVFNDFPACTGQNKG